MNISALRKMLEESTSGEWDVHTVGEIPRNFIRTSETMQAFNVTDNLADAKLICATHNSLSALLDVVEAAELLLKWNGNPTSTMEQGDNVYDALEEALQHLQESE